MTARPIRYQRQVSDRKGKNFYTSITSLSHISKCTGNDKDIEIAMGIKKQSLVLVIKNPYEGYLKQDKIGKLISTKNDFRRHGYGISSIQKVADKYGGDVIIETQDGKFVLTVMMNIGDF